MLTVRETGIVYRNAKPYLRAEHAWHPSVVRLPDGELVATFDLGQAVESLDYHTVLTRSRDAGRTWAAPVPLWRDAVQPTTHTLRLGVADGGATLTAMGARLYRPDPEEGLLNRANLGYTRMDLVLLRSADRGATWAGPQVIAPPLVGPAFETCHSALALPDGRWLFPTATWKDWAGHAPNGMQAIALVSRDGGATWPEYLRVMDRWADGIVHWEQSLVRLGDGRLLAICWAYDERRGVSLPNPYAVAEDGVHFGAPRPTGLTGETAKLLALGGNRVLCCYRRSDQPGLWGAVAAVEADRWRLLAHVPLWQGSASGMVGAGTQSDQLSGLKFGYPSPVALAGGEALVLFWALEDGVHNIRWLRLAVGG